MRKLLTLTFLLLAAGAIALLVPSLLYLTDGPKPAPSSAATACAWTSPSTSVVQAAYRAASQRILHARNTILQHDPKLNIVQVRTPSGDFWTTLQGTDQDGRGVFAHLQAEHQWMNFFDPAEQVKPGDIVIDCGAHVGVFTDFALKQGAAKVISIEPEPTNVECLRRNFSREIASGRVVIVPKAVWSQDTKLEFTISAESSGMNSAVISTGTQKVLVPAARIDTLVTELKLPRIDYIKMDIEGAERHALAGAESTIRRYGPRLMLEMYHLPDDPQVLPALVTRFRPSYVPVPGLCHQNGSGAYVPYVTYFR